MKKATTLAERRGRQKIAAVLLILPIALSILDIGGWLSECLASFMPGSIEVQEFRSRLIYDISGAATSMAALYILLGLAGEKATRISTRILFFCELYTFIYYGYMFINPSGRTADTDAICSMGLLVSVIACCYAWSILLARPILEKKARLWMMFIAMQYIMSFVAFYAMTWQQHIPHTSNNISLLPDYTFLYSIYAAMWNILRCIALWKMCHSRLYDGTTVENENSEGEYSPINKYMIAIAIASFFIIKGLALVYKNYNLILGL